MELSSVHPEKSGKISEFKEDQSKLNVFESSIEGDKEGNKLNKELWDYGKNAQVFTRNDILLYGSSKVLSGPDLGCN